MVTALVHLPAPRVGFRCGVEMCGISSLKIPLLCCRSVRPFASSEPQVTNASPG